MKKVRATENLEEKIEESVKKRRSRGLILMPALVTLMISGCYPHTNTIKGTENAQWGKGNYIESPTPREITFLPGEDPAARMINLLQLKLYDMEMSYFQESNKEIAAGNPIPPRPEFLKIGKEIIDSMLSSQERWAMEHAKIAEANAKEQEARADIERSRNRPETYIDNKHEIHTGTQNQSNGGSGVFKDNYEAFRKITEGMLSSGLSPEEQKLICNNLPVEGREVKHIGTISFEDCIYDPKDPTSQGSNVLINSLEKYLGEEQDNILLFCGKSSKPLGSKCSTKIKDYGNGQLSWNRCFSTAVYVYERLKNEVENTIMVCYANDTISNSRKSDIYSIKKRKMIK